MALFQRKRNCPTCGTEYEGDGFAIAISTVCKDCFYKASLQNLNSIRTDADLIKHMEYRDNNHKKLEAFTPTFSVELDDLALFADDDSKQFYWLNAAQMRSLHECGTYRNVREPEVFSYEELISYGYYENGSQVQNKSGLSRAIVGGLIAGGAGAIVGGMTGSKETQSAISNMMVTIALDNPYRTTHEFIIENSNQIKYGSGEYVQLKNKADSIIAFFDHISGNEATGEESETSVSDSSPSFSDEIIKLKELMDQGILTADEFVEAKQKLISKL